MASGGDEAIEVDFVGQTAVEVVIEAGRACVAALLQARSDTPFHAPGLVHEVCVLGRRAPDQARRLPTNHRPVVDRAGDKAIAVVDTVDAGVLVEHEAAPALTGSGHD